MRIRATLESSQMRMVGMIQNLEDCIRQIERQILVDSTAKLSDGRIAR